MTEKLNFGHCELRFIWNLSFVIWDLTDDISEEKSIRTLWTKFIATKNSK